MGGRKDTSLTTGNILIWTRYQTTKGINVNFARYGGGLMAVFLFCFVLKALSIRDTY